MTDNDIRSARQQKDSQQVDIGQVRLYPFAGLGHADHGWLEARHHFSFASYHDLKRMGFGELRVINDDRISAGKGFAPHAHENMEIITYVREGAITHKDSMGHVGRTEAGNVQVMSAGTGIVHSEYNLEPIDTRIYQIWILPNKNNVEPRWESQVFPQSFVKDRLSLLVSGMNEHEGQDAAFIYADAALYGGRLEAGTSLDQTIKHQAYVLVSKGSLTLNGTSMQAGDGAEVTKTRSLHIHANSDTEILVIDVPDAVL